MADTPRKQEPLGLPTRPNSLQRHLPVSAKQTHRGLIAQLEVSLHFDCPQVPVATLLLVRMSPILLL